jgi:hypothetical protein
MKDYCHYRTNKYPEKGHGFALWAKANHWQIDSVLELF